MKNILIINGHPNPNSYNYVLAKSYKKGAIEAGHQVDEIRITDLNFNPNLFVKLEKDSIKAKMDAIDAYTGEVRDYPHPRSPLALEVIAKRWGTVIGSPFAEAFRVHRFIF